VLYNPTTIIETFCLPKRNKSECRKEPHFVVYENAAVYSIAEALLDS